MIVQGFTVCGDLKPSVIMNSGAPRVGTAHQLTGTGMPSL